MSPWPIELKDATDLAGFLRRKMESAGGKLVAFKTAERFLADILREWKDAYEVAMVYAAAIDCDGPSDDVWNILDLRAYVRLRRRHAPLVGTAYYAYQATFAATGADSGRLWELVEALEDAILLEDGAAQASIRKELDQAVAACRMADLNHAKPV